MHPRSAPKTRTSSFENSELPVFVGEPVENQRMLSREGPVEVSAPWAALESVGHLDRLQSPSRRSKDNRLGLEKLGFGKGQKKR